MSGIGKALLGLAQQIRCLVLKTPFLAHKRRFQEELARCAERLAEIERKLDELCLKLQERTQRVHRLAQRYEEQARKHNKLKHRDLAQEAIRQRVKDQIRVWRWQDQVDELGQRLKALKLRQTQLEAGSVASRDRGWSELLEQQEALNEMEGHIQQLQMQGEATLEQEDGEVSAFL
jgi:chromosome segregation ATPase